MDGEAALNPIERSYLISLAHDISLGPIKLAQLYDYFDSWERVWHAPSPELRKAGLSPRAAAQLVAFRNNNEPRGLLQRLTDEKIQTVTLYEDSYPYLLKHIHRPPYVLFYKGTLETLTEQTLAVVGTRKLTNYGAAVADKIIGPLVKGGLPIVSGLALGADTVAHRITLDYGGKAAAVLGCGPDQIYPASNEKLGHEILASGGTILSEYPPGVPPLKQHFPARNRIISGLSRGVLILEAGDKSGSLITASYALEQGREIFAVPANIFSRQSAGAHELLKSGGKVVTCADDILDSFGYERVEATKSYLPRNDTEATILEVLSAGPRHVDDIIRNSHLDAPTIQQTITLMELSGGLRHHGNGVFSRN